MLNRVMSAIWTEFRKLQPNVQVESGKKQISTNSINPRVVWFPVRDRFSDSKHPGRNPKQIKTRETDLEIHLFAKDFDTLDDLINDVTIALTRIIYNPSILDIRGDYEDPGSELQDGVAYVMTLTLDLVIWERPLGVVKITTIADPVTNTEIQYTQGTDIPNTPP